MNPDGKEVSRKLKMMKKILLSICTFLLCIFISASVDSTQKDHIPEQCVHNETIEILSYSDNECCAIVENVNSVPLHNKYYTDIICTLVDVIDINDEFARIIVSDYTGIIYYVTITICDIEFDPNHYTYYRIRGEYIDSLFEGFSDNFMQIHANSIDFINEFYADSLANEIYGLNLPVG